MPLPFFTDTRKKQVWEPIFKKEEEDMPTKEYKGSFANFNKNMDRENNIKSPYVTNKRIDELEKKVDNGVKYSEYLADNIDKGLNIVNI